jgi:MFS family permease
MTPGLGPQPATRARHWVIVFAITLAVLAYIDRVAISQAAPIITRDLGLSKSQMGAIFSAFGLAYALFEIPGGWLGDRIGPRKVLLRVVLSWSAFTALTGVAWSFVSLWVIRFLFGAGEAGCFPNLTKMFSVWLPIGERTRAQGIMWTFARWGGAFTPPLFILAFNLLSWRWSFATFGLLGVVWCAVFAWWFRDDPRKHPSVNAAEAAIIERGREIPVAGHGDVPWARLVGSRSVWFLWAQYYCLSFPWYFYITWLPTYLQEYRKLTPAESARYAILPLLFGGFGALIAGFLAPAINRRVGGARNGRRLMGMIAFAGAGTCLLISTLINDPLWGMIAMGFASFFNDVNMPGAWSACMDVGGKYAGTVSGSMNMMGNLAGFTAPAIGGWILQTTGGDWNSFLYLMVGVYFLGVLCWPLIDPVTPIES